MVIGFGCCVGSWDKLAANVLPYVAGRPLVGLSGQANIASAYNHILGIYADRDDVDAVVLLHDDLQMTDPAADTKLLAELEDPTVLLVGVAGGDGRHGLAWWNQNPVGHQQTDIMPIDFGPRRGDVDLLEGSFLAFSPQAVRTLRFDPAFPGFHGYDEIGMQAAHRGRVVVADIDTHHHSQMGFKSQASHEQWLAADQRYREKWGL